MSSTYTFSGTDTYSVSDVKAVMQNTFEDIVGFANRQLMSYDRAKQIIEDLTYILKNKALKAFEIQLYRGGTRFKSYRYEVGVSGFLSSGDTSGGISYYSLPADTVVGLFAELDTNSATYNTVWSELHNNRNWGGNGSAMEGSSLHEKSYISNSLQLKRSVITN
jgi:Bacterial HORMA domain family 1